MRFNLQLNEVQYIQKRFHFGSLIGVEKRVLPQIGVEKGLKSKGVIIEKDNIGLELSNEYRYLFSAWEKVRYSVVRPDSMPEDSLFCVLVSESCIILFDQVGKNIALELIDNNQETMDRILFNMGEFDSSVSAEKVFNISLPTEDFAQLLTSKREGAVEEYSRKLGISKDDLAFYLEMISREDNTVMYLSEDHREHVGSLLKVVKTPAGYFALKHVTPEGNANDRMVMIVGDAQMIIDSIYVF